MHPHTLKWVVLLVFVLCVCNTWQVQHLSYRTTPCTCAKTPRMNHTDPPNLTCLGYGAPSPPTNPLPPTKCSRTISHFFNALSAENVSIVPQFGTYLRWYRDCNIFTPLDHDVDLGIFAEEWNRVSWSRVHWRVAWYHALDGHFDVVSLVWWLLYPVVYDFAPGVEKIKINGVLSPLKFYWSQVGYNRNCDLDVWVMYHHPHTQENWRCLPSWTPGRSYRYGPVAAYQRIHMNGLNAYAPSNSRQCVEQTSGKGWQTPVDYDTALQSRPSSLRLEEKCKSLVAAFENRTHGCSCYTFENAIQWRGWGLIGTGGRIVVCVVGALVWVLCLCVCVHRLRWCRGRRRSGGKVATELPR
jgi:hypothetical protein